MKTYVQNHVSSFGTFFVTGISLWFSFIIVIVYKFIYINNGHGHPLCPDVLLLHSMNFVSERCNHIFKVDVVIYNQ